MTTGPDWSPTGPRPVGEASLVPSGPDRSPLRGTGPLGPLDAGPQTTVHAPQDQTTGPRPLDANHRCPDCEHPPADHDAHGCRASITVDEGGGLVVWMPCPCTTTDDDLEATP